MKKYLYVVLSLVLLIVSQAVAAMPTITIAYFDDYAPFSMVTPEKSVEGIFVDIFNEIFEKRLKIPVKHIAGPWARMQMMVENGEADAFCTIPNEKRRAYAIFSALPTLETEYRIYTYKGSPAIAKLSGKLSFVQPLP